MSTLPPLHGGYRPRAEATRSPTDPPPVAPSGRGAASASLDRCDCDRWHSKHRWHCSTNYSEGVGTGAGEGATGQDAGTAWVTRSEDCPEAPAQAHPLGPDGFTPLAPASTCSTCGCGVAGDGDCPCGCVEAAERTREAFALGAAWALGDDEEAPAALRDRIEQVSAERDRYRMAWKSAVTRAGLAADRHAELLAKVEALADEFASNVDWSAGRNNYGDNEAWELAARQARALLGSEER